ncbi:hypothetical protein [Vibrio ouci]|uniref:Peptidase A2 domain-containing protein n=1 Tax=Vibrio ouci TaxID=2499078 RepID=A0A4Y8WBF1_9VIBR|nr:hypothetical protein [Vibrio ouci]TFH89976.1 hypothetical protein ELS82_19220 [Vibrio ouci]
MFRHTIKICFSTLILTGCANSFPDTQHSWPLTYGELGIPIAHVTIGNNTHQLSVDTGASRGLYLYQENINSMIDDPAFSIQYIGTDRSIDLDGNITTTDLWQVDKLVISKVTFNEVDILAFKPWGLVLGGGEQPADEVLGLGLFQDALVLMDFYSNKIRVIDSLPTDLSGWTEFRVTPNKAGLQIDGYLSEGSRIRLVIDTAASHSVLLSSPLTEPLTKLGCSAAFPEAQDSDCMVVRYELSDNLDSVGHPFAILIPNTSEITEFDGILGMDVLRGRQMIIDTQNLRVYISR